MPDALIGRRLGHCKLLEKVGEGGMGSVYRARHETLDKDVAVKVLAPSFRQDKDLVERMLREARLAARVEHPGVVTVQDAGVEDGIPYLVMPFVRGKNLDDILKERKRLKPSDALSAVKKAARAFAAAHKLGIVHRDVKPGNLIVTTDGQVKVTDFGLAVAVAAGDPRLTRADCVVGTPQFMAPEQVTGEAVDARSDIYSLGATLYNLVAGVAPFEGGTALSVAMKHADPAAQPRPIREIVPDLPDGVAALVDRMMAKKPEARFADMESVIKAIEALQGVVRGEASLAGSLPRQPIPKRTLAIAGAAGAGLLLLVLVLLAALRGTGPARAAKDLQEAVQLAAAAVTTDQLAEVAKRYQEVVRKYPQSPEAAAAAKSLKDIEKRVAAAEAVKRREEEAKAVVEAANREAGAIKMYEEAEKALPASPSPAQRKEAAARFRAVAAKCPGTHTAAIAEDRAGELEKPVVEGPEEEAARALKEADAFAVGATSAAQLREASARYRQIAEKYPRTLAARNAMAEHKAYERQAAVAAAERPQADEIPADVRKAIEARCKAFFELALREQQASGPPSQALIRDLMAFLDPDQIRAPAEKFGAQVRMGFYVGRLRREGWKLESWAIDSMTADPAVRRVVVQIKYTVAHPTLGRKESPDEQTWVLRGGEWYILTEPPKDRDRLLQPPKDRDRERKP
jgi:tRNA A-37 threonylcarbamoyl transferase component Bud32